MTSHPKSVLNADQVLDHYRERGSMENHIGEHQSVIDGFLSSTTRPKTKIRNNPVQVKAKPIDAEAANAAALCLHGLAYNLLNTLRLLAGDSGKIMAIYDPAKLHLDRARRAVRQAGDSDCLGEDCGDLGPSLEGAAAARASSCRLLTPDNSLRDS